MYEKETKTIPNYTLMKSAFDAIDLRRDGLIDINEWMKAFSKIEVLFIKIV